MRETTKIYLNTWGNYNNGSIGYGWMTPEEARDFIEADEERDGGERNIEVVRIDRDLVVCKLTDYLRRSAFLSGLLRKYINSAYYDGETKDYLLNQLCTSKKRLNKDEDITDDDGEAVYHFIENDMYDFLTQE